MQERSPKQGSSCRPWAPSGTPAADRAPARRAGPSGGLPPGDGGRAGRRRGARCHRPAGQRSAGSRKVAGTAAQILESLGAERSGALTRSRDARGRAREKRSALTGVARNLLAIRAGGIRRQLDPAPVAPADLIAAAVDPVKDSSRRRGRAGDEDAPRRNACSPTGGAGQVVASLLQTRAHTPAGGAVTLRADAEPGRTASRSPTRRRHPAAFHDACSSPSTRCPGRGPGRVGPASRTRATSSGARRRIHCEARRPRHHGLVHLPAAIP